MINSISLLEMKSKRKQEKTISYLIRSYFRSVYQLTVFSLVAVLFYIIINEFYKGYTGTSIKLLPLFPLVVTVTLTTFVYIIFILANALTGNIFKTSLTIENTKLNRAIIPYFHEFTSETHYYRLQTEDGHLEHYAKSTLALDVGDKVKLDVEYGIPDFRVKEILKVRGMAYNDLNLDECYIPKLKEVNYIYE